MITLTKEEIKEAVLEYIEKRHDKLGLGFELKVALVASIDHTGFAELKDITAVVKTFEPCSSCSSEPRCLINGCHYENS